VARSSTTAGILARRGFQSAAVAAERLAGWQLADPVAARLVDLAAACCDPDLAFEGLDKLAVDHHDILCGLAADPIWARQVIDVLAGSATLQQHLIAHPEQLQVLRTKAVRRFPAELRSVLLAAVGADPDDDCPVADEDRSDDLRLAYRGELVRIAARDLGHDDPLEILEDVAGELADLADATVETALALARHEVGAEKAAQARLGIVALGKTGAQELNYVSDVDVLYIAEPVLGEDGEPLVPVDQAVQIATKLASSLTRICSAHTAAGTIWQIDAALRPEGKAGPLVRTLASHTAYYEKWAKGWEFQAMLKARPMAGDLDLAEDFVNMVAPKVWQVAGRENFVHNCQAMRRRVIEHIASKEVGRELKLGQGGLRDVEFSVQLVQLVHGRSDERLRTAATLPALRALVDAGYLGRTDGREMGEAYRHIRVLEHRAQLFRLRRTHLLPTADADLRRIGRSLGLSPEQVTEGWRRRSRRVLALHRRLFYSPLLEAVARIPSGEVKLTTAAATERLHALGFLDPKAALLHIRALIQGMTRQAEIQRQLLPAMLGWFADGPNPDAGLLAFRQLSEALGTTPWYLRALRDEGAMAERFARILSSSRYLTDLLTKSPEILQMLADVDRLRPRTKQALVREMTLVAERMDDPILSIDGVRAVRRKELFRIGVGDVLGVLDLDEVGQGLSDLASATIDVGLLVAARRTEPVEIGVIALGRWGGQELNYGSDADAQFVVADDSPVTVRRATALVSELRSLLSRPGPEPKLVIDTDLRPEGKGGRLVRSLGSYAGYYQRWSATWEAQALVRAGHGAGSEQLTGELLALMDVQRWPDGGIEESQLREIRRLKARMESERLPRGANPMRHLKLGPGGLSDVEWTVQLIQLQHAGAHPELRTPRTLPALRAAVALGLVEPDDAKVLTEAWVLAGRLRNRITLVRSKASDSLPHDVRELAAVAELMGYGSGEASHMIEDWRRTARQARRVVERLFWGD
jgi:glutamate-ammonia-ligase adenylyltransferase